jgi:hypothetical protein
LVLYRCLQRQYYRYVQFKIWKLLLVILSNLQIQTHSKYSITSTEGNVNSTSINTNDENCEKDSKCGEALDKIINNVFDSENASEIKEGKELENALDSQDETGAELSQYDDELP